MITKNDFSYDDKLGCEVAVDGDYRILIGQDNDCESPREWDNLGKMYYRHRSYNLGDEEIPEADSDYNAIDSEETFRQWVEDKTGDKIAVIIPLEIYDHSGVTMWAGHNPNHHDYQWDCSHVGWIVAMKKDILAEYNAKKLSKKLLDKVEERLRGEVTDFDDYLTGNCYGYSIEKLDKCKTCGNEKWQYIDSCHGYLGDDDYCKDEAIGAYKAERGVK